ncbi:MAG: sensor histidine kinase [Thermodesulfobacteriota bacterium]
MLFLGLASWNSKRLEQTLLQVQINMASSSLESIERLSRELVLSLERSDSSLNSMGSDESWSDFRASLQEAVVGALVELAKELDEAEREGGLDAQKLANLATDYSFRSASFLDGRGELILSYGPLAEEFLIEARRLLASGEVVFVRLVPRRFQPENASCVVVRREKVPGAVLLALGKEELALWQARVSVQEAMAVAGWTSGIIYMLVRDSKGFIWAQGGEIPPMEEPGMECQPRWRFFGGKKALEVALPLRAGGMSGLEAVVGLDPSEMEELLSRNRIQIYLSTAMMSILALLGVVLLHRSQSRHQSRLREMTQRLHQSERLMALGRLAGVVAHEVRNPLNAISMAVQRLAKEYAPMEQGKRDEFFRISQVVRGEISRINRIVEEFLGVTRKGDLQIREIPVAELLERLKILMEPQAIQHSTSLSVHLGEGEFMVLVDEDRIIQALLNLATNAMEAVAEGGGSIAFGVRREGKEMVAIEITDTGGGISAQDVQRVFGPGYTTKGKGLGLGLHIAREIVRLHGGDIQLRSAPDVGTTFSVFLPGRWAQR